ncbi:hypothetical protein ACFLRX_08760 [Acidobacteriota bacterium]
MRLRILIDLNLNISLLLIPLMHQTGKDIKKTGFLDTWKEISRYSNQSVRTCQRWEKKNGFPVYRLDNSSKSRVFAYKDEIDLWLLDKKETSNQKTKNFRSILFHTNTKVITIILSIAVIFVFTILVMNSDEISQPSDFSISGSKLIVLNRSKRILWEHDTGMNLRPEAHFRRIPLAKTDYPGHTGSPLVVIEDIDNNGSREILFVSSTMDQKSDNKIICFSKKGEILWEFLLGKRIDFGSTSYLDDFIIECFKVGDLNNNNKKEVVIIGNHGSSFPSQVLILDSDGKQICEYWNSGHLNAIEFYDFHKDGYIEILLAGINEEFKKPCLAVLSIKSFFGSSPQNENTYKCSGVPQNNTQNYFLFPMPGVDYHLYEDSPFIRIDISNNDNVDNIFLTNTISFSLNPQLKLIGINFPLIFRAELQKLNRKGILSKGLKEIETELFEKGILFFDGTAWSKNYDMSKLLPEDSNSEF